MTLHGISHDTPADGGSNAPVASEQLARQQAIQQIERRRRFWIGAAMSTLLMVILVFIWAMTEYHNAGGWPTQGFSDSSSTPNVWNDWIIYPAIAWVLYLAAQAWREPTPVEGRAVRLSLCRLRLSYVPGP
jgi:hypothetical protein